MSPNFQCPERTHLVRNNDEVLASIIDGFKLLHERLQHRRIQRVPEVIKIGSDWRELFVGEILDVELNVVVLQETRDLARFPHFDLVDLVSHDGGIRIFASKEERGLAHARAKIDEGELLAKLLNLVLDKLLDGTEHSQRRLRHCVFAKLLFAFLAILK